MGAAQSGDGVDSVLVRDGVDEDLEQLTSIYNHYVLTSHATFDIEPFSVPQRREHWFRHFSHQGPHRVLVAATGAKVLGYAASGPFRPKAAYATTAATSVYCAPDAVGRRIGSLLYSHLLRVIEGQGLHRVMAGVTLPNDASLALHRKFGFEQIGIEHEVGRKFDRYWDVARFERPID